MIDTIIAVFAGGFIGFIFGILFFASILTAGIRKFKETATCDNCRYKESCNHSENNRCGEWRSK